MFLRVNGKSKFKTEHSRWLAVKRKDERADGYFVYAVSTTGIYCRPACAAKPARRIHVSFFHAPTDAERAGFRACKRCRPNAPSFQQAVSEKMTEICKIVESADESISVSALAAKAGMALPPFSRRFKAIIGVSPKQYAAAQRRKRVRAHLRRNSTVTNAIYDSGFNSNGRFYDSSTNLLGMKPMAYKRGGAGEQIRYAVSRCPLGYVLVAATDKGICSIILGDDPQSLVKDLQEQFRKAQVKRGGRDFDTWIHQVVRFIKEPANGLKLPLDIRGTAFQQRVWQALSEIPMGTTKTYSQIASRINQPKSVRAVAGAIAANKLALAIPCHRVIRSSGDICGFRWGVKRKAKLLAGEKAKMLKS